MYGKTYESMYDGSMVGAGINVFAVWNYMITKNRRGFIEVNPKLLAFTLGGSENEVEEALEYLCAPDPKSRSKLEDGRRLVKDGQYQYRMVNWEYYEKLRNENDRREYNRMKQAQYRAEAKEPMDAAALARSVRAKRKIAAAEAREDAVKAKIKKDGYQTVVPSDYPDERDPKLA